MIEFMHGGDNLAANQFDELWDNNAGSLVTGAYGVGKAWVPASNLNKTLSANLAERYFSFHYLTGSNVTATIHTWQDGSSVQVDLRCDSTGALTFTRNGTNIGTASGPGVLIANTTYYFTGRIKIDPTAGIAELKIAGAAVLNSGVTNLNTRNSANSYFNQVRCLGSNSAAFDNYFVINTTGGSGNDLAGYPSGELVIDTKFATGAGADTQWTPSTGSNYQNIDDATPNGDTDYNSSATPGQIDDFAVQNLSATSGTIVMVSVGTVDRIDDATPRTVSHHIKSSSATLDGTAFSPSSTFKMHQTYFPLDPNTSAAWTVSGRNAANFGYSEIS